MSKNSKKNLVFKVNNKELYLDKVLVDFDGLPLYFVCKDEDERYYMALCTDTICYQYILVSVTEMDLYLLLNEKLPMRDIILKQEKYWEIMEDEDGDSVELLKMSSIIKKNLPKEGAVFKILTEDMKEYVKKFNDEFKYVLPEYKGYKASVKYDKEDNLFVGTILGIKDVISFHANEQEEIKRKYKECVDNYIEIVRRK